MRDSHRKQRQREREQYQRNQRNNTRMPGQDDSAIQVSNKKKQNGPTSKLFYQIPTVAGPIIIWLAFVWLMQFIMEYTKNLPLQIHHKPQIYTIFSNYHLTGLYLAVLIFVMPFIGYYIYKKTHGTWFNNNAMYLTDDLTDHTDDAYIRSIDNLTQELNVVPDTGLGYNVHVSTLMGHMMVSNKGIKKVMMPQFDGSVDGYIKRDEEGNIVKKRVPMFDPQLADELFSMTGVPQEYRTLYDATDYDFNRKLTRKEGGDGKKRAGEFGRKEYDKLSDYINNEFYPLDTDYTRPAGVYFVDSRPVNTILIAITRAGKGQTVIEPSIDVWSRAKKKWNMFMTDPKGELLAKFYYPLTVRGFDIVQFNLMHPNLTSVFNPLANALQAFRQNDPTKGTSLVDSIVDMLFPDNGEIWNPAAGNMFRRAVYLLFDYYIEQEKYIRYIGHKNNTPQEIIDSEVDKNYSKITLFNVYSLIGDLAAKKSKDVKFINVDPSAPPVNEKDLLTLVFDAMAMLPTNDLRSKAITANNAIKQIAGAEQTISGIYATLLTGLSIYADDTAIALMSGSPNESFDVAGLGFPRRVGIQLDSDYVSKFRLTEEMFKWEVFADPECTKPYAKNEKDDSFEHVGKIPTSNWIWGYFAGIVPDPVAYIRLTITVAGTVAKQFLFKFVKGYRKYDDITYVINPITHKKEVSGGTLIELDPKTKQPTTSTFKNKQLDIEANSYHEVEKPIIVSNQVFYSEKPKAIFAVTPPHLQVYQKHILVIIKQILDEQYSNSYVIKQSRKPIVGTQMMLDEFGNIRSGKNGIPNIDTATSIALGQDVQITFVLQSFQQLRAIYGEDVEKILRANSSNTIFLKSNDKELIDELVRLSGSRHKFQMKSKSVSRKEGDLITVSEPVINYSGEDTETTALTANDLLFLAAPSPGNSITFSSGEMPIVNKLSTIVPMAAGLHGHKRLPEPAAGQYSDATMPTPAGKDSTNYLDNMIDGEALTRARVAQAKIWTEQVKPKLEKLAEKEGVTLNESDGSLSEMVMNIVYEIYDKEQGQSRESLADPEPYWKKAAELRDNILTISDHSKTNDERIDAVHRVKEMLTQLILDPKLDDLTKMYSDTQPTGKINVGFDQNAVGKFVVAFARKYPKPEKLETEHQDIFADAKKDANYHEYTDNEEKPFDILNPSDTGYLESYLEDVILGRTDGDKANLTIKEHPKDDGSTVYRVILDNQPLWRAEVKDGQIVDSTLSRNDVTEKAIANNAVLMNEINTRDNDGDN